MSRFRVPLCALALLVATTAAMPASSGAQGATPAAKPATKPQRPTQATSGPGSSEARFGGMTTIEQTQPGQLDPDYWIFVPRDPLSGDMADAEPFPVVIFVHGYSLSDPDPYLAWIEHLVHRGAVVLYPEWQGTTTDLDEPVYRENLLADVGRALDTLEQEDVAVDVSRVAVVGHSAGGVLAVDYAASAATAGLPVPTAVMSVSPACATEEIACLGADLRTISPTTRVLLVTGADDFVPGGPVTLERLWSGISTVPLENRDIVTLITDGHGVPALLGVHGQALADYEHDKPDAFDWYGTWKWLDALMGCAFDGEWCEVALGNTPEQRYMGEWSDGVPVTEAVITDDPA